MLKFLKNRKFWVLFTIFFFPLALYLFLITGTNNFAKLPVLTEKVADVTHFISDDGSDISLDGKISIVCFLGDDIDRSQTNALNLNQKIYKRFNEFNDFQFLVILPKGKEKEAKELKKKIAFATDMSRFRFLFGTPQEIKEFFESLKTNYSLDTKSYTKYAFIIDKNMHLRGRTNDEDTSNGLLYGYSAETVAPIHNKMVDDVKVLVAEYRMALKKNRNERKSWLKNEKE
ncbi:MAG: hypothetical protein QNJ57_11920 [Flavobacteriaceae bacterium]|nr:hypothetical protein [Flavobacteriaceae bacterium]